MEWDLTKIGSTSLPSMTIIVVWVETTTMAVAATKTTDINSNKFVKFRNLNIKKLMFLIKEFY